MQNDLLVMVFCNTSLEMYKNVAGIGGGIMCSQLFNNSWETFRFICGFCITVGAL